jgi:hypothetical protein
MFYQFSTSCVFVHNTFLYLAFGVSPTSIFTGDNDNVKANPARFGDPPRIPGERKRPYQLDFPSQNVPKFDNPCK